MTVLDAVRTDDELEGLRAVRDRLAAAIDEAGPVHVAGVAGRLQDVLRRIAELDHSGKVTLSDALAERRIARATGAELAASAAGQVQRAG